MVIEKILVPPPALWPSLQVVPRATGPKNVDTLTIEHGTSSSDEEFDRQFLIGCDRTDFVRTVLTPELIQWLLADPRSQRARLVWESEDAADDGVQESTTRAVLSTAAEGCLTDHPLTTDLLNFACDVMDHLPPPALTFNRDQTP